MHTTYVLNIYIYIVIFNSIFMENLGGEPLKFLEYGGLYINRANSRAVEQYY